MSISERLKDGCITLALGILANLLWDVMKGSYGGRWSVVLAEGAYFVAIAGIGFFLGKRRARRTSAPSLAQVRQWIVQQGPLKSEQIAQNLYVTQERVAELEQQLWAMKGLKNVNGYWYLRDN